MTLKEQIIEAANKSKSKTVPVKAWGIDAFVRVMSGTERDAWESGVYSDGKVNMEKFRARLVVKTLADHDGKRLFEDSDLNSLSDMDSLELDRIYSIAAKANGLTKADVDELTKNS